MTNRWKFDWLTQALRSCGIRLASQQRELPDMVIPQTQDMGALRLSRIESAMKEARADRVEK